MNINNLKHHQLFFIHINFFFMKNQEAKNHQLKNLEKTLLLLKNHVSAEKNREIFNFENTGKDRSKISKRLSGATEIPLVELKKIRKYFSELRLEISDCILDLDNMIESKEHIQKLKEELEEVKFQSKQSQ